jgi:hypothetical protein
MQVTARVSVKPVKVKPAGALPVAGSGMSNRAES